jgi:VanZ family protein
MSANSKKPLVGKGTISLTTAVGWSVALIFLAVWSLPAPEVFVFSLVDKVKHGAAYGVLGLLWAAAFFAVSYRPRWRLATGAAIYAFAWGALTEAIQSIVPGRQASLADLVADAIGVVICVTAFWWANPLQREAVEG